jgi:hypothetical protein
LPGEWPDAATELVASKKAEMNPAAPDGKCPRSREWDYLPAGKLTGTKPGKFQQ